MRYPADPARLEPHFTSFFFAPRRQGKLRSLLTGTVRTGVGSIFRFVTEQTNKQRSTDNRELSRLNHARARKRTQSPTPGGRGSVSPRLAYWRSPLERPAACSPDSWSGALYVGATVCSGGGWRPEGPPSVAVIVVTRRAHGACVRVERATPRAAPRESAIAPRALGLINPGSTHRRSAPWRRGGGICATGLS